MIAFCSSVRGVKDVVEEEAAGAIAIAVSPSSAGSQDPSTFCEWEISVCKLRVWIDLLTFMFKSGFPIFWGFSCQYRSTTNSELRLVDKLLQIEPPTGWNNVSIYMRQSPNEEMARGPSHWWLVNNSAEPVEKYTFSSTQPSELLL